MKNLIAKYKILLCKIGYHKPKSEQTFNGANLITECCKCNKRIARDSQSGWFAL